MRKRIAVLLSGCGVFDGSDLYVAVLTLLALDRAGAKAVCTAPNVAQHHVINHLNQEEMDEQRNVLTESARIARGDIYDLSHLRPEQIDGLIIPAGFGTVKNLSDFALEGPQATVDSQVERVVRSFFDSGKPIGASGMAAVTLVKALTGYPIEVTVGDDPGIAAAIESMGAQHRSCRIDQVHVDDRHKIVTTPIHGGGPGLQGVAMGAERMVGILLDLMK